MTQPIIAIVGGLALIGFIVFAFRQGMKVTPDSRPDGSGHTNYGNYDGGSGGSS
jgi:hypothetical protein